MRQHFVFVCTLAVLFGFLQVGSLAADQPNDTVSFTKAQADAGMADYGKHCATCHGADLAGIHLAPSLIGDRFDRTWRGKSADILSFHLRRMPPKTVAEPVSLSEATYAPILAHILQANGFEAGDVELPSELPALAKIEIPKLPGVDYDPVVPVAMSPEQVARLKSLPPVTDEIVRQPSAADWLHWGNNYAGHSYSPLDQIRVDNVQDLKPVWRAPLRFGSSMPMPIVYQGILFLHTFPDTVLALDATNGDVLWRYQRESVTISTKKMGLALYGDKVFVSTTDLHLIALDARTGTEVWDHAINTKAEDGASRRFQTRSAPLIAGGKVIQGLTGGGTPMGAFIVAVDIETGQESWRFNTIARPGEPGGNSWNGVPLEKRSGGSVWHQGTFDPELNLVYYGVAPTYDTGPLLIPVDEEGVTSEALYTNCTLALDVDTGKLVWHFQHMANDQWDLDWAFERQIVTIPVDGKPRKVVTTVGKMAMLEALDAATGEYLFTIDAGVQNVVAEVDPKTGAKTYDPTRIPNAETPCIICPGAYGARSWPQASFSPRTRMAYVPIAEWCMGMGTTSNKRQLLSTGVELSLAPHPDANDGMMGRVQAFDLVNRKLGWTFDQVTPPTTGLLATGGGLVFSGDLDPSLKALDDTTGKLLWQSPLDDAPASSLITYSVNDKQYVVVVVGMTNNWVRDITNSHNQFVSTKGFSSPKSTPGKRGGAAIWAFALKKFVRDWTTDELASAMDELDRGRSFDSGHRVYEAASCKACHRLGHDGATIGPNLAQIAQRMRDGKMSRLDLLTEIVEPSKVIDQKYRTQVITTQQGNVASGVVVFEDDKVMRLLSNPLDSGEQPQEVAKADIEQRAELAISLMPHGLLNTLTKPQILDLLAYLESGGDPAHPAFGE